MKHQFTLKKTKIIIQQDLTDLWTVQGCSLPKRLIKTRLRDSNGWMRTCGKEVIPVCFEQIHAFYWKSKTDKLPLLML